jgi:hypothetical protein
MSGNCWTGPLAYLLVTEVALTGQPTTPWVWAARPSHDLGGALCAVLLLIAGTAAVTFFGARDSGLGVRIPSSRYLGTREANRNAL